MVKVATFAKPETVMPHSKKTTVQQTNDRNMTERKANPSQNQNACPAFTGSHFLPTQRQK
jgi:hypothetical protein